MNAIERTATNIAGLFYLPEYVSPAESAALIAHIDAQPWDTSLLRRVQHYGFQYDYVRKDYRSRGQTGAAYLGELPAWLAQWGERLYRVGHIAQMPEQAIINEYQPGQGISLHIDCLPCFGDTIVGLSLGSSCIMVMQRGEDRRELLLEPGSLLVLQNEARFKWKHGISARKTDVVNGQKLERGRRLSVTFRTMKR